MADPRPVNAANPDEIALVTEQQRLRNEQATDDLRDELSSEAGRRRVWHRLERYGLYREITGDREAIYRALGQRSLGLRELAEITTAFPDLYLQMQREAMARAAREAEVFAARQADVRRRVTARALREGATEEEEL